MISICAAAGEFGQAEERREAILEDEPGDLVRARRWLADILSWNGEHAESLRPSRT